MAREEKLPRTGLSVPYLMGWHVRRVMLTLFGPAQLGSSSDPIERLKQERRERSARAVVDG